MGPRNPILGMNFRHSEDFAKGHTSGLDGIFSPTLSAARWTGFSSPARLREVMVKVAV